FKIGAAEGPVPRGLQDGLRVGVGEHDGGVVVHVGVDQRFVVVDYGGDCERGFAVHQPGGQVGAVAAEVVESAGAVLDGVGEPVEELRSYADLLWTLVAVVGYDAANLAQAAGLRFVVG